MMFQGKGHCLCAIRQPALVYIVLSSGLRFSRGAWLCNDVCLYQCGQAALFSQGCSHTQLFSGQLLGMGHGDKKGCRPVSASNTLKLDWLNLRGGFPCGGLTLAQDHWRNSHAVGSYLLLLNFNAHPSNWMKTQAATFPSLPDTLRTVSEQWRSMLRL